jgi:hypothetical protein
VPVNVHGTATGPPPGFHIAPPVPHHKAPREVDPQLSGGRNEQARCGLSAGAAVSIVVEAHIDPVDGDLTAQLTMHVLHHLYIELAPGNVRLIGDHDYDKSKGMQPSAGTRRLGVQLELIDGTRSTRPSVPYQGPVQNPVTIEEHRR